MPATANIIERDVVVVGAGFGGCYLLHLLRKKGFSTTVIEAFNRLGGVWAWSCYPGARVDCELPYYGFSDPAIWSTWTWTQRFPAWQELRTYFDHVDKCWDLSRDVVYNSAVNEAIWNEHENVWNLKTSDGQRYRCKWFIAATGTSYKKSFSDIKGIETFKGALHHSAAWPDNGLVALEGKRVAVIGAGSTGIQVLQESAKVASSVTQFIRSPNFALPMRQRTITEDEIYANKAQYEIVFRACRKTASGLPVENSGVRTFSESKEERRARWEEGWKRGGFNWANGGYVDLTLDREANRAAYDFWREKTLERIKDPGKAKILAPEDPSYFIATKRPSLEHDYYEMASLDHVEITNSGIAEITETGIRTKDGKTREFDVIAMCTGYDAVTGGLRTMGIKGRGGIDLDQKWEDGVVTHLGMSVGDFPNFWMVYGPQAPTSLTNGPTFIEMQCELVLDALTKQRQQNIQAVCAKPSAEEAWRKHVLSVADQTLLIQTDSWYMGANVPGKRREMLIYVGGIPRWHKACRASLEGWKDFETKQSGGTARL